MKKFSIVFSIFIILALVLTFKPAPAAAADSYWLRFGPCTNENGGSVATGLAQMWVNVVKVSDTQADFTFYNIGPGDSSIADVYFADGALLQIASIIEGPGVQFSQNATPSDLPGGGDCLPVWPGTTAGFSADSDPPVAPNGVNNHNPTPGDPNPFDDPDTEFVTVRWNLTSLGWTGVENELLDGTLRIGIHVQAFEGGYSESFATNFNTSVDLMSFSATPRAGNVNVKWTTGTELNNAGFNLYRSSSELGTRTRLNNALIAARGDAVSGGSYSFTDAPGYGTFFYWLEDVELGGTASLHGPVVVTAWPSIRLPVSRPAVP